MTDNAPNPPAIPVPEGLDDEAVIALVDFLYTLAHAIEGHYIGEILRYRAEQRDLQLSFWDPDVDPY